MTIFRLLSGRDQEVGMGADEPLVIDDKRIRVPHSSSADVDHLLITRAVDELIAQAKLKASEPGSFSPSRIETSVIPVQPWLCSAPNAEGEPEHKPGRISVCSNMAVEELEDGEVSEDHSASIFAAPQATAHDNRLALTSTHLELQTPVIISENSSSISTSQTNVVMRNSTQGSSLLKPKSKRLQHSKTVGVSSGKFLDDSNMVGALNSLTVQKCWPLPEYQITQRSSTTWVGRLIVNGRSFVIQDAHPSIKSLKVALARNAHAFFCGIGHARPDYVSGRNATFRNVITELNNYAQKHFRSTPTYNLRACFGRFSGSMVLNGITFSTSTSFKTAVEAKAELARQGYRFFIGMDWDKAMEHAPASGANLTPTDIKKPRSESFEKKLSKLVREHRLGYMFQYKIQSHELQDGFVGDLQVDNQFFRTCSLVPTPARAREVVAEKAYAFFEIATRPRAMIPVPEFDSLKKVLGLQTTLSPALINISSSVTIEINQFDKTRQGGGESVFDMSLLGKLSSTLQKNYHQNPQWYERSDVTVSGEPMYACLLRWATAVEPFGDLGNGYPDRKFARLAAAKPALAWLRKNLYGKMNRLCTLNSGTRSWKYDGGTYFEGHSHYAVDHSLSDTNVQLAKPEVPSSVAFLSSDNHSYGLTDCSRPPDPRYVLPLLSPTSDVWQLSNNKRAAESQLKENECIKKLKIDSSSNGLMAARDSHNFNRVEHVDGRYGF